MKKKLNVFIDGTWLFRVCQPEGTLSNKLENSSKSFPLNFEKLNDTLLNHVKNNDSSCSELGDLYFVTSIFNIPEDIEEWPQENPDISDSDIQKVKRGAYARRMVAQNAQRANYSDEAIFHPNLKHYMIEKLKSKTFQEKQVDASVVALIVRSAITKPNDYHLLITGDSDIIPAIKVAYPEYSKNVVIATTHPDELKAEHRQTSFSFNTVDFRLPPFYLQDYVGQIVHGENVYNCGECFKVFTRSNPIPVSSRPYCTNCYSTRT